MVGTIIHSIRRYVCHGYDDGFYTSWFMGINKPSGVLDGNPATTKKKPLRFGTTLQKPIRFCRELKNTMNGRFHKLIMWRELSSAARTAQNGRSHRKKGCRCGVHCERFCVPIGRAGRPIDRPRLPTVVPPIVFCLFRLSVCLTVRLPEDGLTSFAVGKEQATIAGAGRLTFR